MQCKWHQPRHAFACLFYKKLQALSCRMPISSHLLEQPLQRQQGENALAAGAVCRQAQGIKRRTKVFYIKSSRLIASANIAELGDLPPASHLCALAGRAWHPFTYLTLLQSGRQGLLQCGWTQHTIIIVCCGPKSGEGCLKTECILGRR